MLETNLFEKTLGYTFKNKSLLKQAFIHRSYINENGKVGLSHNERLEFLGDAVLELVITDFLYEKFPESDEGDLTAYRSALVNAVTLGQIAKKLEMNNFLLLSKGESKDIESKARLFILADTYEAVVGALYMDGGYSPAKLFIEKTIFPITDDVIKRGLFKDSKSLLQEKAQEIVGVTPAYKVMKEKGPDHDKNFVVGVFFGDTLAGEGSGKSKQEAEQSAASNALTLRNWTK